MRDALTAVERGETLSQASRLFGVPRQTLVDYHRKITASGDNVVRVKKCHEGRDTVFSAGEEAELKTRIIRRQKVGFPVTQLDVRKIAFQVAESAGKAHRFGEGAKETGMAGKKWMTAFKHRHPEIALRTTETLSYGRGACLNRQRTDEFYDLLEEKVKELGVGPSAVYNMDETGTQMCTRATRVLAERGSRRVPQASSGEKGETVSVVACISASGQFLPPFVLMKGKILKPEYSDGLPPGSRVKMTEKGYMTSEAFLGWMQHFVEHKVMGPAILIMDGHSSHESDEALKMAEENQVKILLLPSHTSHELQPLDKTVFKAFKTNYYEQSRVWHVNHAGRSLNKLAYADVFRPAWLKTARAELAIKAFASTGICPLNRTAIPEEAFEPAVCSERTQTVATGHASTSPPQGRSTQEETAALTRVRDEPTSGDVSLGAADPDLDESDHDRFQAGNSAAHQARQVESSAQTEVLASVSESATESASRRILPEQDRSTPPSLNDSGSTSFAVIMSTPKIQRSAGKRSVTKGARALKFGEKQVPSAKRQPRPAKRSKLSSKKSLERRHDECCAGCGEGVALQNENWIKCGKCGSWWHVECTSYEGVKHFICDLC